MHEGRDLDPLLYLFFEVAGLEGPAHLVQEKRERVEQRSAVWIRLRPVRDPGEKTFDLGLQARLLLGLAEERIEDRFAVVDASGREPVRPAEGRGVMLGAPRTSTPARWARSQRLTTRSRRTCQAT